MNAALKIHAKGGRGILISIFFIKKSPLSFLWYILRDSSRDDYVRINQQREGKKKLTFSTIWQHHVISGSSHPGGVPAPPMNVSFFDLFLSKTGPLATSSEQSRNASRFFAAKKKKKGNKEEMERARKQAKAGNTYMG